MILVEKLEPLCTVDENVKWYICSGKLVVPPKIKNALLGIYAKKFLKAKSENPYSSIIHYR